MDYLALISVATRLIDLHDCERNFGSSPGFTREERPGKRNGVYLDIAMAVIECLKKLDERTHLEYMSFQAILEYVQNERDAHGSDVLFVLNVLRRPSELHYIQHLGISEPAVHVEKRRTALVEKTDYADEYRLSHSGRLLISLATVARDSSYLRGDAYNLLHAIEWRHFDKVLTFAEDMSNRLRTEILDVRAALEKIGHAGKATQYIDRFGQYRKVIDETIHILQNAERDLDHPDMVSAFEQWMEVEKVDDMTFNMLRNAILRVRQTLTIFNRLIAELVSNALKAPRNAIKPVNFLSMAMANVTHPVSDETHDFLLSQWGPVELEMACHSVDDGKGAVRYLPELNAKPTVFEDESTEPVVHLGKLRFLAAFGQLIADDLSKGPLLLSDALEKGYFKLEDQLLLGDLVGTFAAPESLPIESLIEIRVSPNFAKKSVGDHASFYFNDIEIRAVPLGEQD
jgi:hypothetical protein